MGKLSDHFPLTSNEKKKINDLSTAMENVAQNLMEHSIFA